MISSSRWVTYVADPAKRKAPAEPSRSEGQIPGPQHVGGRWVYSGDAKEYAAELLALLGTRNNLSIATLTLFGRGWLPRERALKQAYAADIGGGISFWTIIGRVVRARSTSRRPRLRRTAIGSNTRS